MTHVDSDHLTEGEEDLLEEQLEPTWSSELSRKLHELVHLGDLECTKFQEGLQALENPTVIELRLLENARNFAFRDSLTGLYNSGSPCHRRSGGLISTTPPCR